MKRIAALILTYHPDPSVLREALCALCPQVEKVLIVDNGTHWDGETIVSELAKEIRDKVEFMWLDRNLGVGAGHNHGIGWARAGGFTHVLILDHDSVPRPDMVGRLAAGLDELVKDGIAVAAVAPRWLDRYTGHLTGFVRLGTWKPERVACNPNAQGELLEADFVISSGSLIPMTTLDVVGDMNEDFFIDHVDTDWIFRARTMGFRSFGVCDAIMEHSLGTATLRFWLGRWRTVPLHGPERHYYIFRNSMLLLRMAHAPRRWVVNNAVRLASMAVVFPLFAPQRLRRMRLMLKGLWDGLHGVTGPLA